MHEVLPFSFRFKRIFDLVLSIVGIGLTLWLMPIVWVMCWISCGVSGLYRQQRVGRNGKLFEVYKFRTMRAGLGDDTTVTSANDKRITSWGRVLRKYKIDEFPQLFNIVKGDMSFVGPRPDVPGFTDKLKGDERIILSVKPGITGPATLKFRSEEELLALQDDPEFFNREVIWPEKVRLNVEYVENYSFCRDIWYLWKTLSGG